MATFAAQWSAMLSSMRDVPSVWSVVPVGQFYGLKAVGASGTTTYSDSSMTGGSTPAQITQAQMMTSWSQSGTTGPQLGAQLFGANATAVGQLQAAGQSFATALQALYSKCVDVASMSMTHIAGYALNAAVSDVYVMLAFDAVSAKTAQPVAMFVSIAAVLNSAGNYGPVYSLGTGPFTPSEDVVAVVLNNRRYVSAKVQLSIDGSLNQGVKVDMAGQLCRHGNPSAAYVTQTGVTNWNIAPDTEIDAQNGQAIFTLLGKTFTTPGGK